MMERMERNEVFRFTSSNGGSSVYVWPLSRSQQNSTNIVAIITIIPMI